MYEKLAMDCRTLSRINVMFSNKAEAYHDHKKQLFKMAASRKSESKIIDLRISFWSHRFLYKQWNLNLPPTLSQNQIATTVEDFNESVQAADAEAFILREDLIKIAPSSFVGICGIFE